MKVPANCRLIGRWRIVEADIWDRAYLDLSGPATLTITAQAARSPSAPWKPASKSNTLATPLAFTGPAARKATRSMANETPNFSTTAPLEIEFEYRNGDEAVLKAKRMTSSTAC